jgi:heme-degrading monooxygenase HmoA
MGYGRAVTLDDPAGARHAAPGRPAFAPTRQPPYYAVIFSSRRRADDAEAYGRMAERMEALAAAQPGFLGVESARGADGFGITVSYWASEADVARWKANAEHLAAQVMGRRRWYERYEVRVARVERAYAGSAAHTGPALRRPG